MKSYQLLSTPSDFTKAMQAIQANNDRVESAKHEDAHRGKQMGARGGKKRSSKAEGEDESDDDDKPLYPPGKKVRTPGSKGRASQGKAKASGKLALSAVNLRNPPAKLGERVPALPSEYIKNRTGNFTHCNFKSDVAFRAVSGSLKSACRDVSFNAVSGIWHAKNASILTVSMHAVSMGNQKYGSHYKDYVEKDGVFVWSGQNSKEDSAAHKLLFEKGRRVHLYLRRRKKKDTERLRFTYFGELQFVRRLSPDGAVPPRVQWKMKDFGELKAMKGGLPKWAIEEDNSH